MSRNYLLLSAVAASALSLGVHSVAVANESKRIIDTSSGKSPSESERASVFQHLLAALRLTGHGAELVLNHTGTAAYDATLGSAIDWTEWVINGAPMSKLGVTAGSKFTSGRTECAEQKRVRAPLTFDSLDAVNGAAGADLDPAKEDNELSSGQPTMLPLFF